MDVKRHGIIQENCYIKHEKEKDKLRMAGGAWSINLDEVDVLKVDIVMYITEEYTYTITTEDAMKYGFQRLLGGEIKLVVPERCWIKKEKTSGQEVVQTKA
jgi:hypothetical protein